MTVRRGRVQRLVHLASTAAAVLGIALLVGLGLGPRTGAYRTLTVFTGSMSPTFEAGSMIVQTPVDAADIRVGDVITYRIPVQDKRVVTHRVVDIVEPGNRPVVVTQGDGNEEPDPWTARLEGDTWRTRASIPLLGSALERLRSDGVRQVTTVGLPFLLAVLWLKDIWKRPNPSEIALDS